MRKNWLVVFSRVDSSKPLEYMSPDTATLPDDNSAAAFHKCLATVARIWHSIQGSASHVKPLLRCSARETGYGKTGHGALSRPRERPATARLRPPGGDGGV